MAKFKIVCRHCGSENVLADAYAAWNVDKQEWELVNAFEDGSVCDDCGQVDCIEYKEIDNG